MSGVAIAVGAVAAGSAIYSGMEQKKAAKKANKYQNEESARKQQWEEDRVKALQKSPLAMAAPIVGKFGLGIFDQAFSKYGFDLPMEDIVAAMGLDRIIKNNAEGRPWDYNEAEAEATKQEVQDQAVSQVVRTAHRTARRMRAVEAEADTGGWVPGDAGQTGEGPAPGQVPPPMGQGSGDYLAQLAGSYSNAPAASESAQPQQIMPQTSGAMLGGGDYA